MTSSDPLIRPLSCDGITAWGIRTLPSGTHALLKLQMAEKQPRWSTYYSSGRWEQIQGAFYRATRISLERWQIEGPDRTRLEGQS